jgi:hypothetical protein
VVVEFVVAPAGPEQVLDTGFPFTSKTSVHDTPPPGLRVVVVFDRSASA